MASLNKVMLIGNLGKDPEVRFLPSGDAVCNFSVATSESWTDSAGVRQERTEWHNVALFRKLAEVAGQYLKKGSAVFIEGSMKTRKYQDKDGKDCYSTTVEGATMKMLGKKDADMGSEMPSDSQDISSVAPRQEQAQPANSRPAPQQSRPAPNFADMDDDIPF